MTSEDIITLLFVAVDDTLPELKQPSHAKLHPSELVTIGSLMARKGTSFSAFYRGLKRDVRALVYPSEVVGPGCSRHSKQGLRICYQRRVS